VFFRRLSVALKGTDIREGTASEAAEKCRKTFLQGLKPVGFEGLTQGLKPLPPKEKAFCC